MSDHTINIRSLMGVLDLRPHDAHVDEYERRLPFPHLKLNEAPLIDRDFDGRFGCMCLKCYEFTTGPSITGLIIRHLEHFKRDHPTLMEKLVRKFCAAKTYGTAHK